MSTKIVLLLVCMFFIGCNQLPENDQIPQTLLKIVAASSEHKDIFGEWVNLGDVNAKLAPGDYNVDDLVEIRNEELSRWAVANKNDPNTSLSFVFDSVNNIDKVFISTSIQNLDNSITSMIYTVKNEFLMEIVHKPDGSINIIEKGTSITLGWWKEYEYCVNKVGAPFESYVANWVTGMAFSTVTLGMWAPSVLIVCAGVASGRNYQN